MMKSRFVQYHVVMSKEVGTKDKPQRKMISVKGIVKDTPEKLGKVFRQNTCLMSCTKLEQEDYYPIYC